MTARLAAASLEALDDAALARRAAARDADAIRLITRRNNQRLYRAAWSVLKHRAEAEEAVQEGYVKAFAAIDGFKGEAALSTWLTRIVLNEALGRRRSLERRARLFDRAGVTGIEDYRERLATGSSAPSPESAALNRELRGLLERAVSRLPDAFRSVFVLREIEDMSVAETAQALDIPEATVKTRLHRARRHLQDQLDPELRSVFGAAVEFAGADCEGLTAKVMARLGLA
ncbi:MAG: RNA polymerase sigma factor [Proteobacteria bacterium]|nr:RNA polymerase sigma factor [Pseudomonadota bacterium]